MTDFWELRLGANPRDPSDGRTDADGDGFSNRQESLLGFDPSDPAKTPPRGLQTWRFETLGRFRATPVIGPNGIVYVTASNGHLDAIDPDGTRRWRYSVPASVLSAPTLAPDGTIYVAVNAPTTDQIHAIGPDGTLRWTYETTRNVLDAVVLGPNGRVYYAGYTARSTNGTIELRGVWEALSATGQRVAGGQFPDRVSRAPAVGVDGDVYVTSDSGDLRAFDEDGTLRWTLITDASGGESPVVEGTDRIYFSDNRGRTHAVSRDGELLWTRESPDRQTRSTVTIGGDGTLYIGAWDSKLYAVDPDDGTTVWAADTFGTSFTPAVAGNGTVYVTTFGGSISAYSPSGTLLWRHRTGMPVSAPPVIDRDGTLYFGSETGGLVAVADSSGGLADTPWAMSRHDAAGTAYTCFDNARFSTTVDTDGDGLDDCTELKFGLDPSDPGDAAADLDGDGLSNADENIRGTDMSAADSDRDGLSDGQEVLTHRTDPLQRDTDGDSIHDGLEIGYGWNPLDSADALLDSDGDGFSNRAENWGGADPTRSSSTPVSGAVVHVQTDTYLAQQTSAIADDGTIYRRSRDGLEAVTSHLRVQWNSPTAHLDVPVVAHDGTIYLMDATWRRVVALFPNGRERWSYSSPPGTAFYAAPALGNDGTLFLGQVHADSGNIHLIALDRHGRLEWDIDTLAALRPGLSVDHGGNLIAHTNRFGVNLYRGSDGRRLWRNPLNDSLFSDSGQSPVVDEDGTIYITNGIGLHALNSTDGASIWMYGIERAQQVPIITASGLILIQCQTSLCAITRQGALAWRAGSSLGDFTPVVGANGTIYVGAFDALLAFDDRGTELWRTPAACNAFCRPHILHDGMIYLAGSRYSALIVSNAGGLADSAWPVRGRDQKNSRNAGGVTDQP